MRLRGLDRWLDLWLWWSRRLWRLSFSLRFSRSLRFCLNWFLRYFSIRNYSWLYGWLDYSRWCGIDLNFHRLDRRHFLNDLRDLQIIRNEVFRIGAIENCGGIL